MEHIARTKTAHPDRGRPQLLKQWRASPGSGLARGLVTNGLRQGRRVGGGPSLRPVCDDRIRRRWVGEVRFEIRNVGDVKCCSGRAWCAGAHQIQKASEVIGWHAASPALDRHAAFEAHERVSTVTEL